MTTPEPRPTKAEAVRAAGEIYGQILADPERAAEIAAARAKYDAEHPEKGGDLR